ncbi:hypothetical protein CEXT_378891 [Caerostris extrusa]|uniref:Uncharacterized protein n=1 Tax=Caerostris extrusa TaxID=172846 RepID=A0AAV4WNW0_CAEEX|nr:hypothetical protein CEXT_378891 [Caerostris extrusa]
MKCKNIAFPLVLCRSLHLTPTDSGVPLNRRGVFRNIWGIKIVSIHIAIKRKNRHKLFRMSGNTTKCDDDILYFFLFSQKQQPLSPTGCFFYSSASVSYRKSNIWKTANVSRLATNPVKVLMEENVSVQSTSTSVLHI